MIMLIHSISISPFFFSEKNLHQFLILLSTCHTQNEVLMYKKDFLSFSVTVMFTDSDLTTTFKSYHYLLHLILHFFPFILSIPFLSSLIINYMDTQKDTKNIFVGVRSKLLYLKSSAMVNYMESLQTYFILAQGGLYNNYWRSDHKYHAIPPSYLCIRTRCKKDSQKYRVNDRKCFS